MKKVILIILCSCMLALTGCVRTLPSDLESIDEALVEVMIPTSYIFANKIETIHGNQIDRVEMMDLSNPNQIVIHIMVYSDIVALQEDYKILITTSEVYSTKTMTKTPHAGNLSTSEGKWELINEHTTLMDVTVFNTVELSSYIRTLTEITHTRVQQRFQIRGIIHKYEREQEQYVFILIYERGVAKEMSFRREKMTPSTKQVSNFVSGTHYAFTEEVTIDFPSVSLFSSG